MRKVIIFAACLAVFVGVLTGCDGEKGSGSDQTSAGTVMSEIAAVSKTAATEPVTEGENETPQLSDEVKQAYMNVLAENESQILGYADLWNGTGNVAIADICGDGTPELLFVSDPDYDFDIERGGDLHIYSYIDGNAVHVLEWKYIKPAGVGGEFALVQTENDDFYVISDQYGHIGQFYEKVNRYELKDGGLSPENTLSYDCVPYDLPADVEITAEIKHSYNGSDISAEEYKEKCKLIADSIKTVLIIYGYEEVITNSDEDFAGISAFLTPISAGIKSAATDYAEAMRFLQ